MEYVVPLARSAARELGEVGGKARGLGRLQEGGFRVPEGFCLAASAYRAALEPAYAELAAAAAAADPASPAALDAASERARSAVLRAALPDAVRAALLDAYRGLAGDGKARVAVRSSATAEDLPDLSFAGQADSFLDVAGEEALLEAVRGCWASLWSARSIAYRARAGLSGLPEMAVVVQLMADARAAGVLFTADPVGGSRADCVIEAVPGLGDALVSGRAAPERFAERGGELLGPPPSGRTISAAEALELAALGRAAQSSFGFPLDIEWAIGSGGPSLLQARPITSLYPLPEDGRPCGLLFSFGSWQGFLEPFTPLGSDFMLCAAAGVGRLLGVDLDPRGQRAFREAGGRLWVETGGLMRWEAGRAFARLFLGSVDPQAAAILAALGAEGALPPIEGRIPARAVLALLRFAPRVAWRVLRNLILPARGRRLLERRIERAMRRLEAGLGAAGGAAALASAARRLSIRLIGEVFPEVLGGMVSSQVPFQALMRMSAGIEGAREEVLALTRGLSHNVTTEMDLELWAAATAIKADPEALRACSAGPEALARAMRLGGLPEGAAAPLGAFMGRYGVRGPGEIDLGKPRWSDDPLPLARALSAYLGIEAGPSDPASLFAAGAERARAAASRIEALVRGASGGAAARRAAFLAGRVRELTGLRESPKFGVVRIFGGMRGAFLAAGAALAASGALDSAEDVFFLRLEELEGDPARMRGLAAAARAAYARESRRRRVPRLMAGDGRAWFDPPAPEGGNGDLMGCPVSPGTAVGRARVVLDPAAASLEPGDILVCPGTDPAWTPLFMAAAGLVTVVGGEMTHGSVVAREYGIPAVVGVAEATERIPEGARILVDGSRGLVRLL